MKNSKNLLILTLCFAFIITTVDSYSSYANYEITPFDHHHTEVEKK